jgi:predicted permease
MADLKCALRQLYSNPGFSVVTVLTLAVGIGVNTAIFTVLNALILRPLAVPNSSALLTIYRGDSRPFSYPDFADLQIRATAFSGLAADVTTESALDVGDSSQVILAEAVSYNYASVLQLSAIAGRWFSPADERHADFVAVISDHIWRSRFAADPQILGKQVRLESQLYTVVGVAPQDFPGMSSPELTDIWVPLLRYAQHNEFAARVVKDRSGPRVLVFGRLHAGASESRAQADLNVTDQQLRREYVRAKARDLPVHIEHVRGTSDPGFRRMLTQILTLLSSVVAIVLLISCANVANLLLGRAVARRREISIRVSLGASRWRICRQLLVESLLLSLAGAAVGFVAAQWSDRIFERGLRSAPSPIALGALLSPDLRVLAFVSLISVLTTVLFGLLPAMGASKPDLLPTLKGSQPISRHRRWTLRNISVVVQVTLSLVLLIIAGLFVRALQNANSINPGFDSRNLLSVRLYVAKPEFNDTTGRRLYHSVLDRVGVLPGVASATLSYTSPMLTMTACVAAEHAADSTMSGENIVGPNYFSTYGVRLQRGRDFAPSDKSSAPLVAIVNETLAGRYPLGSRIRISEGCDQGRGRIAEVIGVVKDAQYGSLDPDPHPYVFIPFDQRFVGYIALVVRTRSDPRELASVLPIELRKMDDRLRIYETETVATQFETSLWRIRWQASLLSGFGSLSLLIASVGLYGVIAYAARQRTREFGIRLAIGAQRRDVLQIVMGDALVLASCGIGFALPISLSCTRLLRSFLFGISATDPKTYLAAALLWTAVALIAASIPAYRATKVDPSTVLRDE